MHETLDWPFFEPHHRDFAQRLEAWAATALTHGEPGDVDAACRDLVRRLGEGGWLGACVADDAATLDVRSICLARDILARHTGLADFAFVMQGLGTATVALAGTPALRARVLPAARAGKTIAAFALSEPGAGSDVAAIATTAARVPGGWRLDGEKTWISNGGIASHYVVFARSEVGNGAKGLSAFLVPADAPGLSIAA